ncbi:hypothetical protein SLA2020_397970 [Shorea laevis]
MPVPPPNQQAIPLRISTGFFPDYFPNKPPFLLFPPLANPIGDRQINPQNDSQTSPRSFSFSPHMSLFPSLYKQRFTSLEDQLAHLARSMNFLSNKPTTITTHDLELTHQQETSPLKKPTTKNTIPRLHHSQDNHCEQPFHGE